MRWFTLKTLPEESLVVMMDRLRASCGVGRDVGARTCAFFNSSLRSLVCALALFSSFRNAS